MGENSKIEWCDHTFNGWWGCTKVSPLCDHCYAATFDRRVGGDHWGNDKPRRYIKGGWANALKWNRAAAKAGERHRVFCASMSDVFESYDGPVVNTSNERMYVCPGQEEPITGFEALSRFGSQLTLAPLTLADLRTRLFGLIAATPHLDWILLTKRPGNALKMAPADWPDKWPDNVWAMASAGTQAEFDRVVPRLLRIPARIRGLSMEPLLEKVDISEHAKDLDWIIVGGESGAKDSRPMHPYWVHDIRWECDAADVPFFFKQWGDWGPFTALPAKIRDQIQAGRGPRCHEWDDHAVYKVGKHVAGRTMYDGVTTYNGVPS